MKEWGFKFHFERRQRVILGLMMYERYYSDLQGFCFKLGHTNMSLATKTPPSYTFKNTIIVVESLAISLFKREIKSMKGSQKVFPSDRR